MDNNDFFLRQKSEVADKKNILLMKSLPRPAYDSFFLPKIIPHYRGLSPDWSPVVGAGKGCGSEVLYFAVSDRKVCFFAGANERLAKGGKPVGRQMKCRLEDGSFPLMRSILKIKKIFDRELFPFFPFIIA